MDIEFEFDGASKNEIKNEGDDNTGWTTVDKGRIKSAIITVKTLSSEPTAPSTTTSQFVVGGQFEDKKMYLGDPFYVAKILVMVYCGIRSGEQKWNFVDFCMSAEQKECALRLSRFKEKELTAFDFRSRAPIKGVISGFYVEVSAKKIAMKIPETVGARRLTRSMEMSCKGEGGRDC